MHNRPSKQTKSSLHLHAYQSHIWCSQHLLENSKYSTTHNPQKSLRETTDSLHISPLSSLLCPPSSYWPQPPSSHPCSPIGLSTSELLYGQPSDPDTPTVGGPTLLLSPMIPFPLASWQLLVCPHAREHNCSWVYVTLPVGLSSRQTFNWGLLTFSRV